MSLVSYNPDGYINFDWGRAFRAARSGYSAGRSLYNWYTNQSAPRGSGPSLWPYLGKPPSIQQAVAVDRQAAALARKQNISFDDARARLTYSVYRRRRAFGRVQKSRPSYVRVNNYIRCPTRNAAKYRLGRGTARARAANTGHVQLCVPLAARSRLLFVRR